LLVDVDILRLGECVNFSVLDKHRDVFVALREF